MVSCLPFPTCIVTSNLAYKYCQGRDVTLCCVHMLSFHASPVGGTRQAIECMLASWAETDAYACLSLCQHTLHAAHPLQCKVLDLQLLTADSPIGTMSMQSISRPRSSFQASL